LITGMLLLTGAINQSINQSISQSVSQSKILLFIKKHKNKADNKSIYCNVTTV